MSLDDYTADQAMCEVRRQWHEERAKLQEELKATQRELEYVSACSRLRDEENRWLTAMVADERGMTDDEVRQWHERDRTATGAKR